MLRRMGPEMADAVMRTRATDVRFKAMSGSRAHFGLW
jgi:hypothetical protein